MGMHAGRQEPMHVDAGMQDVRCEDTAETRYEKYDDWMIRQLAAG